MYKVQIITATSPNSLADKVAAALNKLNTSPIVSRDISMQYQACCISPEKAVPSLSVPTVIPAKMEYSCMIGYSVVEYKPTSETITNH